MTTAGPAPLSAAILARLTELLGRDGVLDAAAVLQRATSHWDPAPMRALALVRPRTTGEVSAVLGICHAARLPVVVQGGLTGTVSGAVPDEHKIALSLERMNAIERVDAVGGTCIVQAGAVLQGVQTALAELDLLLPLDLGARGSCTIGGTVATNAGGINVLRYGMMRNLVLGLEAVLADGTVLSSMNEMLKNNAGFDLKQLFIGTEGTLGVVTRVVLRLFPRPASRQTAMLAFAEFDHVTALLNLLKRDLGGTLSACEVMWNNYFGVQTAPGLHRAPLARDHAYYAIIEAEGAQPDADAARFKAVLEAALESGLIADAVIPKSEQERRALWDIREDLEPVLQADAVYLYDVSVPIKDMAAYVGQVLAGLHERWPDSRCCIMGHVADGNLHLFVEPRQPGATQAESDEEVYSPLQRYAGSVSAEHGIGRDKKSWLGRNRSPQELELMRSLKRTLDPQGLLNPGCVVDT